MIMQFIFQLENAVFKYQDLTADIFQKIYEFEQKAPLRRKAKNTDIIKTACAILTYDMISKFR